MYIPYTETIDIYKTVSPVIIYQSAETTHVSLQLHLP